MKRSLLALLIALLAFSAMGQEGNGRLRRIGEYECTAILFVDFAGE